jgi:hypothetical protein
MTLAKFQDICWLLKIATSGKKEKVIARLQQEFVKKIMH